MLRTGPVIALAALCGVCLADCGVPWWADRKEGVRATYNLTKGFGYFEIPMATDQARKEGWVLATQLERFNADVYCMENNPSYCCIYNKKGIYSGFLKCLSKQCVDATDYEAEKVPAWNKMNMMGHELLCVIVLFFPPDELRSGGGESCPRVGKGIYIVENNNIRSIPTTSPEVKKVSGTEGKCVPKQGNHSVIASFTKDADCNCMHPVFMTTDPTTNNVTGVGCFFPYNCMAASDPQDRQWDEMLTKQGMEYVYGDKSPDCFNEANSLHTFMIRDPQNVTCP